MQPFITLIRGDRGSGKTAALVAQLFKWLDTGVPATKIGVVVRNRYRQKDFVQRFWQSLKHPIGDLHIWRFQALVYETVWCFYPLLGIPEPQKVGRAPALLLLEQYLAQQPEAFSSLLRTPRFFERLQARQRLRSENGWSWEDFIERSHLLQEPPLAQEANQVLAGFQAWLWQHAPPLLDESATLDAFQQLHQQPEVKPYWQNRYTHWLIDDIEEATPLEQDFYERLWHEPTQQWVYSANPWGGVRRHLGARPAYLQHLQARAAVTDLPVQTSAAIIQLYHVLQHQPPPPADEGRFWEIKRCREPGALETVLIPQLEQWQTQGVSPSEVVWIGWHLPAPLVLHLQTIAHRIQWPLDVFQGARTIQSDPLVRTLLALLRLVLWQKLKQQQGVPPLQGWDFYLIYRVCGRLESFAANQLFHQWRNHPQELEGWGQYLREHMHDSPALLRLFEVIPLCREQYLTTALPDIFHLTHYLFTHLLLPVLPEHAQEHQAALLTFMEMVSQYADIQSVIPETEALLVTQMLKGDIPAHMYREPLLERSSMKLMTASKLCEMGYEAPFQIWLDVTAEHWWYSSHHPLFNPHLLSQEWPLEKLWNMDEDNRMGREKLATIWRKGLQYCQKKALVVVFEHDRLGRHQYHEDICNALQGSVVGAE